MGVGNDRFVAGSRLLPSFAANHRNVAGRRILSQRVVIGTWRFQKISVCFRKFQNRAWVSESFQFVSRKFPTRGDDRKYPESLQEVSTFADQRKVESSESLEVSILPDARRSPTKFSSTRPEGPSEIPLVGRELFRGRRQRGHCVRERLQIFLSQKGSAIPLQSMGTFLNRRHRQRCGSQSGRRAILIVRKTLPPFPYLLRGSLHPKERFASRSKTFMVSHPPRHFLYKRHDYKRHDHSLSRSWIWTEHGRSKDSRPEKPLRFP